MVKRFGQALLASALLASAGSALASPSIMAPSRSVVDGNAFYDDFYGPFYDGYWTISGNYFFTTGPARPYVRDDGRHFSKVMASGFRPVEGVARGASTGTTALR